VHIPQSVDVWMTQHEITDLFGCFISKVKSNTCSILKSSILRDTDVYLTYHCQNGSFVEVYGLELIIALSFRIQSGNAEVFRRWLTRRLTKAEIPEMHQKTNIKLSDFFQVRTTGD
jgi:Virulence protein